jgi:hypothetical protein
MENVLINIDSKFRNIEKYSNPGNFTYILKEPLKNINFIRLASIELPTTFYTFLGIYDNTSFTIAKPDDTYIDISIDECNDHSTNKSNHTYTNHTFINITIDEGNYNSTNIIETIQLQFNIYNTNNGTNFLIQWNPINYKVTISDSKPFSLILGNDNKHKSLGYRLGYIFNDCNYLAKNQVSSIDASGNPIYSWVGDTFLNITKEDYLFVRINDYGVIYNDSREKTLLAKIILNDSQFVIDNGANFLTKTYIFKQLINLSKLEIELINHYGQTIDMNYIDFSMTLEVGQIYDSNDYNKYNFDVRKRY